MKPRAADEGDPPELPRGALIAGTCPPAPRVAIIGARAALRTLLEQVPALVAGAAAAGHAVVSGGAAGIDGAMHRAALRQGVPQCAVLPLGPDRPYPPAHEPLFHEIAASPHSAVVFALARGCAPTRACFASRNAVVVALSRALCVVQAEVPSGSFATAKLALRRGLPVAVLPGSAGTAALAARGARVLTGDLAAAVAAWLEGRADEAASAWPEHLQCLRIALLAGGGLGASVEDLPDPLWSLALLSEAESLGLVAEVTPGRFAVARP